MVCCTETIKNGEYEDFTTFLVDLKCYLSPSEINKTAIFVI